MERKLRGGVIQNDIPRPGTGIFPVGKRGKLIVTSAYLQWDGSWVPWTECTCEFYHADPFNCFIDYHRLKATQRNPEF